MNVNRLYMVKVNIICEFIYRTVDVTNIYGKFCKETIVYHNENNEYIDLKSGEKYKSNLDHNLAIGDMYIDFNEELIPINELAELGIEKNMSKRKVLKKLSNTSLYNKKEEDE